MAKCEIRKPYVDGSKSIIIHEENKTILFIIPQEIDPIKFKYIQELILNYLNGN